MREKDYSDEWVRASNKIRKRSWGSGHQVIIAKNENLDKVEKPASLKQPYIYSKETKAKDPFMVLVTRRKTCTEGRACISQVKTATQ